LTRPVLIRRVLACGILIPALAHRIALTIRLLSGLILTVAGAVLTLTAESAAAAALCSALSHSLLERGTLLGSHRCHAFFHPFAALFGGHVRIATATSAVTEPAAIPTAAAIPLVAVARLWAAARHWVSAAARFGC